jgi:Undecaprenyl-phosphate galactose phosphotransferase WbaP
METVRVVTPSISPVTPANLTEPTTTQIALPRQGRLQAWRQKLVVLTLICSDILLALLFWGTASAVYWLVWDSESLSYSGANVVVVNVAAWIIIRAIFGLYPGYGLSQAEELRRQTLAALATFVVTVVFIYALAFHLTDEMFPVFIATSNFIQRLVLAPLGRQLVKHRLEKRGLWGKPIAVLGAGEAGKRLVRVLRKEWGMGLKPIAVFDFRRTSEGSVLDENVPYGGTVADAIELARKRGIDTAFFAMPHIRRKYLAKYIDKASAWFRYILVVPNVGGAMSSAIRARDLTSTFALEIKQNLLTPGAQQAKRALDLMGVIVGGLLISPVLLGVAVLIKLDSAGPVLYKQERLGPKGKHFWCWKFRSMHVESQRLLTELLQKRPDLRTEWEQNQKLRDDPRITRVGRVLRKTSMDELPQLWNVLRGEMSLVGPRPMVSEEVSKYGETYALYKRMRPGITGLWQVSGRNDTSYEERVHIVAAYVRNWSVWIDLVILARTVGVVVLKRGAI